MHKCVDAFNFGPTLISGVHVFYNDISSCIMNGGFTSGHFNVTNGVRQGDPLSPYLFILALETLATTIRSEANVERISAYGKKQKIVIYADDITAILPNIKSAKALFTLLKKFENSSGLRVNVSKYQNSRTRRQVVDFFIFCLNKPYGKLFSKNALKGSAALWFCQNRGEFEIRHFRFRPRSWPPLFD